MEKKGKLLILASGKNEKDTAQRRGHLFEKLMSLVLKNKGFKIEDIPNINYAGMEIDIEGKSEITNTPFYAECKYHEKDITAPKLQQFFGKYMAKWLQNEKSTGLFIAIPGLNTHAKGYYKEYLVENPKISLSLFEKKRVLEIIYNIPELINPVTISNSIKSEYGSPGDWTLVYTEIGFFWIQLIIPPGQITASKYLIFRGDGEIITAEQDIDYLINLYPDISNFERITTPLLPKKEQNKDLDIEQIVEVKGSSAQFEYHYPASPAYFIGRTSSRTEIITSIDKIINKKISSRGILIKANSGYGKSSLILKSIAELERKGHFGIAIDSRSAYSSKFILKVVEYILKKFNNFNGLIPEKELPSSIGGFEGCVDVLYQIGKKLQETNNVLLFFLTNLKTFLQC